MKNKILSMEEAIAEHVKSGSSIFFSGMQHGEPSAAIHEIIRQEKRRLTILSILTHLSGMLVAEGCVEKVIFGYFAELFEKRFGYPITKARNNGWYPKLEEYSHFALATALLAGTMGVPFLPIRSLVGSDLHKHNPNIGTTTCPFTDKRLSAVKAINPDVAIVHVQLSDQYGNAQKFGSLGMDKWGANAADVVLITTERIVPPSVIKRRPNATIIPACRVRAVIKEPWGAYPLHLAGCYESDVVSFRKMMKEKSLYDHYLETFIYKTKNRADFMKKMLKYRGRDLLENLALSVHPKRYLQRL